MSASIRTDPTHEDPTLVAASESIGGPSGRRMIPSWWWTPVRVVMAIAGLVWLVGMAHQQPCASAQWVDSTTSYHYLCYSDIPYAYSSQGLFELHVPFTDSNGRYEDLKYPVLVGYFAYGTAWLTHAVGGFPDLSAYRALDANALGSQPFVKNQGARFMALNGVLLGLAFVAAAGFLAGAHRGRPWDAAYFAAAPVVALAGLVNWDMLAVLAVAIALWAWARGRPALAGVMIGLGTAVKLYPVLLLAALFIVALRRQGVGLWLRAFLAAAVAWLVVDLPAMLTGFDHWTTFWTFSVQRGGELGSLWLLLDQFGLHTSVGLINAVIAIVLFAVCMTALMLGLIADYPPRVAQLAFVIVAMFLIVDKVYSPQYVLWLIPLAVLARPRWKSLMIWQAGEIFYFAAVWWKLGGITATPDGSDHIYQVALVVRILAELFLVAVVLRDILAPRNDPARSGTLDSDPMWPEPRTASRSERLDDDERELAGSR